MKQLYGLVGKNISHSFSREYFTKKFAGSGIDAAYLNFDLQDIRDVLAVVSDHPGLRGLNVTIPYKQEIIHFLDSISPDAGKIGAVNTIRIERGKLAGFNTDWIGFRDSLVPMLEEHHKKALILGTGGAARAVAHAFETLGISYDFVSRSGDFGYAAVGARSFAECHIIVNCTPVGTFPAVDESLPVPYYLFTEKHLAYDLIYNPDKSMFLNKAEDAGARIKNGREMLERQAEESWKIWNSTAP